MVECWKEAGSLDVTSQTESRHGPAGERPAVSSRMSMPSSQETDCWCPEATT